MAPKIIKEPYRLSLEEQLELSYLNLDFDNLVLDVSSSPLLDKNLDPLTAIVKVIRNPYYLPFTCENIFNIDLLPHQHATFMELYESTFPLLVATRGYGKSFLLALYILYRLLVNQGIKIVVVGAAFRQSKLVAQYCESFWNNAPVLQDMCGGGGNGLSRQPDKWTFRIGDSTCVFLPLGDGCLSADTITTYDDGFAKINKHHSESSVTLRNVGVWGNGKFRDSTEAYNNGVKPTKIITTKKGYSFEGTYNHKMRVLRDTDIVWVRADEMKVGDHILIDRSWRWHSAPESVSLQDAYALGLMIGDGSWVDKNHLRFTTKDPELIESLQSVMSKEVKPDKDGVHYNFYGRQHRLDWMAKWGLDTTYTKDKKIPDKMLSASREAMAECIAGLFDTDGTLQVATGKGGTSICVSFSNTSKELVDQMQYILLHYGIVSYKSHRDRNAKWNRAYELLITGQDVHKFATHINFRLSRKRDKLNAAIQDQIYQSTIGDVVPNVKDGMMSLAAEIQSNFPGDSALSAGAIKWRKNITRDRISKFIERYKSCNDPFITKLIELSNPDIYYDEIKTIEDGECQTFDLHVPEGNEYCANGFFSHNSTIRGLRANIIIADEFSMINPEVYETVVKGFGAVSKSPNLGVKEKAKIRRLKELGQLTPELEESFKDGLQSNQSIIAGTAYYIFNSFYRYYSKYKKIIESQGDDTKLRDIFPEGMPKGISWKDFSVIQIPCDMIPDGFMDMKNLGQTQGMVSESVFNMEYFTVFPDDSTGFFRRRLIESCVVNEPLQLGDTTVMPFSASLHGEPGVKYVMGIDPAAVADNFAIVILACYPTYRKIVYCWTTNKKEMAERVKAGLSKDNDYYTLCAQKIRELLQAFPCEIISIDTQGGGVGVIDALRIAGENELPIFPVLPDHPFSDGKARDDDDSGGLHIVEMVNFASATYTSEANHGMRKDFETKSLLFPFFDSIRLARIEMEDAEVGLYDSLEDVAISLETLKDELATINHSQTGVAGRDRWDTPEIKLADNKKGRMRKDRYSALVMANMAARRLQLYPQREMYQARGGFAGYIAKGNKGQDYVGPDWFTRAASFGRPVR